MSGPLKCRVRVSSILDGEESESRDCGQDAAVGLVTHGDQALELYPLCTDHAPEEVHEASVSMDPRDWAVVTLAYGASGGDLR